MNHLQLAFRNLKRRPARSILTALGVALAVGSFITLYGLSRSVQENVQQSFEERGTDLTVRRRGIAEPFGGTMPQSIIPEIAKIPGVAAVSGQLLSFAATDNDDHVIAFGWAADSFYWADVPLLDGRLPQPGERQVAIVGKDIARTLDKHVGDDITLLGEKFRVIGISNYASIINRNAVVVELADLQEITFRTGAVTFISVKLAPPGGPEEADRVAKRRCTSRIADAGARMRFVGQDIAVVMLGQPWVFATGRPEMAWSPPPPQQGDDTNHAGAQAATSHKERFRGASNLQPSPGSGSSLPPVVGRETQPDIRLPHARKRGMRSES